MEGNMSNKACRLDQEAWKYIEKTPTRRGWGGRVRQGLFIVAIIVAAVAALVALLHVARVIP
jgi:hypothetical protein